MELFGFGWGNLASGLYEEAQSCHSSGPIDSDHDNEGNYDRCLEFDDFFYDDDDDDDFLFKKPELQVQGVDPKKGWNFRGVHKVHGDCIYI